MNNTLFQNIHKNENKYVMVETYPHDILHVI